MTKGLSGENDISGALQSIIKVSRVWQLGTISVEDVLNGDYPNVRTSC